MTEIAYNTRKMRYGQIMQKLAKWLVSIKKNMVISNVRYISHVKIRVSLIEYSIHVHDTFETAAVTYIKDARSSAVL